jgi:hypothetical protein
MFDATSPTLANRTYPRILFLATSHEIKAPAASVIDTASLHKTRLDPGTRSYTRQISTCGVHLMHYRIILIFPNSPSGAMTVNATASRPSQCRGRRQVRTGPGYRSKAKRLVVRIESNSPSGQRTNRNWSKSWLISHQRQQQRDWWGNTGGFSPGDQAVTRREPLRTTSQTKASVLR